jgi:hypothetical protein
LGFERFNLVADCGMGDEQFVGGAPETQVPGDGFKSSE